MIGEIKQVTFSNERSQYEEIVGKSKATQGQKSYQNVELINLDIADKIRKNEASMKKSI